MISNSRYKKFTADSRYILQLHLLCPLQLAIWHCVITGIMAINAKMMKLWETTITFFSCACAYVLGLPMATEVIINFLMLTNGPATLVYI